MTDEHILLRIMYYLSNKKLIYQKIINAKNISKLYTYNDFCKKIFYKLSSSKKELNQDDRDIVNHIFETSKLGIQEKIIISHFL